jgi:hypothetical protein
MVGVVGLAAACRRRFWPIMLRASAGFLLVLWNIDRYTV